MTGAQREALVTVVTAVRDGEAFLSAALESVLAQTGVRMEVIVVDDGSVDSSAAIARGFEPSVRCISTPPLGLGAARNVAIDAARGEFIAFADCDDLWPPDRLATQMRAMQADPPPDLVFGHEIQFPSSEPTPRPAQLSGTALIRRDAFARVGAFDVECRVGDFLDWLLRAHERGVSMAMIDDVVLYRRLHNRNMTLILRHEYGDYARILGRALARRRAHAGVE